MSGLGYTLDEIDAIAGWLREGLSGKEAAHKMTVLRGVKVTRNAIIGIVLRNKRLNAIGFARSAGSGKLNRVPQAPRPSEPRPAPAPKPVKQHLHPHNIVAKANSRQFDREMPALVPTVFECRSVPLVDLKRGECRWPTNSPKPFEGFLFCGLPSDPDRSYCPTHHLRSIGRGTDSERAAGPVPARAAA